MILAIGHTANLSGTSLISGSATLPPAGSSDHLTDQSSDKDSISGSQNDLRNIPALPTPTDFLSMSDAATVAMPKLMTPDAFMTPSTSVWAACITLINDNPPPHTPFPVGLDPPEGSAAYFYTSTRSLPHLAAVPAA